MDKDDENAKIKVTPAMVEAGIAWFEINNEGRFPDNWPLASHFVIGLLSAALDEPLAQRRI
jgi:hypothetical protein